MFGGNNRRVFAASNALDSDSDLPDDPVRFVRKNVSRKLVALARACRASCCPGNGGSRALHSVLVCSRRDAIASGLTSTPSAITTTMLHLCSAPCKALRFAPPALRAAFGP
jgi:hypothetical protein